MGTNDNLDGEGGRIAMTYETGADGVLTDKAICEILGIDFPTSYANAYMDDYRKVTQAQHQATLEWAIEKVEGREKIIENYLRSNTREGDCPCEEHQTQIKEMAQDIIKAVLEALGGK